MRERQTRASTARPGRQPHRFHRRRVQLRAMGCAGRAAGQRRVLRAGGKLLQAVHRATANPMPQIHLALPNLTSGCVCWSRRSHRILPDKVFSKIFEIRLI